MRKLLSLLLLMPGLVFASRPIINNNYFETVTLTSGVSESELAEGLSMAASSGGHQFDFATYDWQGSIVGAWYDDEDAVSFGVGKRWEKIDAMFHGAYTQNGNEDLVVIGGTFRF